MFSRNDLLLLNTLKQGDYTILVFNGHDIHLRSLLTGHEWIVVSPYDNSACEIRHRHSMRDPFHIQPGRFSSLSASLSYIINHDKWWYEKMAKKNLRHLRKPL